MRGRAGASPEWTLLQVCVYLDGSNAENKISLLVILCIIMYVKKKKSKPIFFFTKPIMVKCLNIGKNIGKPIYRSISNRKATITQITTRYNQDMQNTISEHTKSRTLKQMGYSSRRPHRVPLLSAKNRKRRLQSAQAHQNWTIEDWKNVACSDESRFLLRHSDGRVRIWRKEHESMDPSCLVSTVQAVGGVMVWGKFSWHFLYQLIIV